jgi:hypothetical protein
MRDETLMAFPCENDHNKEYNWINKGMTLRDYFAAMAMQAYASSDAWRVRTGTDGTAFAAYMQADAMLKARDA